MCLDLPFKVETMRGFLVGSHEPTKCVSVEGEPQWSRQTSFSLNREQCTDSQQYFRHVEALLLNLCEFVKFDTHIKLQFRHKAVFLVLLIVNNCYGIETTSRHSHFVIFAQPFYLKKKNQCRQRFKYCCERELQPKFKTNLSSISHFPK